MAHLQTYYTYGERVGDKVGERVGARVGDKVGERVGKRVGKPPLVGVMVLNKKTAMVSSLSYINTKCGQENMYISYGSKVGNNVLNIVVQKRAKAYEIIWS